MLKFTFKTVKPTGRYHSFEPSEHVIKVDGKEVGSIADDNSRIRLMVRKDPTKEDPAPFRWVLLKYRPESLADAKEFLNRNAETIQSTFDLYSL